MSVFSETLKSLRKRNNLTIEELASKLAISTSHVERLETGYIQPNDEILDDLSKMFGVSKLYLKGSPVLTLEVSEPGAGSVVNKYVSVPVVKMRSATKAVVRESDIIDHIVLPLPKDRDADFIGIFIDSDDLDCPRVMRGDTAIVMITNKLFDNDWVAVSFMDRPVIFRKYARMGPTILLTSEKGNTPITYDVSDDRFKIVGKLIGFQGSL